MACFHGFLITNPVEMSAVTVLTLQVKRRVDASSKLAWHPLGTKEPGILQARALEWVAISFSNA